MVHRRFEMLLVFRMVIFYVYKQKTVQLHCITNFYVAFSFFFFKCLLQNNIVILQKIVLKFFLGGEGEKRGGGKRWNKIY